MRPHDLVDELGRRTGSNVALNAEGVAALTFDNLAVTIEVPEAGDIINLYAVVADLPPQGEQRAALCERLLALNLFGQGTGQAAFAIDPLEDEVILSRVLNAGRMEYSDFEAAMDDFVTRLEASFALIADAPPAIAPTNEIPAGNWIRG